MPQNWFSSPPDNFRTFFGRFVDIPFFWAVQRFGTLQKIAQKSGKNHIWWIFAAFAVLALILFAPPNAAQRGSCEFDGFSGCGGFLNLGDPNLLKQGG